MSYAELVCRTAFSFREGASLPEEIVDQAAKLGLSAVAITDREGVYGIPRAFRRSQALADEGSSPRLISGALVTIEGGPGMALLARTMPGWSHLCRLLTRAHCGGVIEDTVLFGPAHPEIDAIVMVTVIRIPW